MCGLSGCGIYHESGCGGVGYCGTDEYSAYEDSAYKNRKIYKNVIAVAVDMEKEKIRVREELINVNGASCNVETKKYSFDEYRKIQKGKKNSDEISYEVVGVRVKKDGRIKIKKKEYSYYLNDDNKKHLIISKKEYKDLMKLRKELKKEEKDRDDGWER